MSFIYIGKTSNLAMSYNFLLNILNITMIMVKPRSFEPVILDIGKPRIYMYYDLKSIEQLFHEIVDELEKWEEEISLFISECNSNWNQYISYKRDKYTPVFDNIYKNNKKNEDDISIKNIHFDQNNFAYTLSNKNIEYILDVFKKCFIINPFEYFKFIEDINKNNKFERVSISFGDKIATEIELNANFEYVTNWLEVSILKFIDIRERIKNIQNDNNIKKYISKLHIDITNLINYSINSKEK